MHQRLRLPSALRRLATAAIVSACVAFLAVSPSGVLDAPFGRPTALASSPILDVYVITVDRVQLGELTKEGRDIGHVAPRPDGRFDAEIVLTADEADELAHGDPPFEISPWLSPRGLRYSEEAAIQQAQGYTVWRSFDEEGGIRDELEQTATDHPDLVKSVLIGTSVQDRPLIALKVTKDAVETPDGDRPAVLFSSLQHAREWIAVEVNRRLMHHLIGSYGTDPDITQLLDTTEVWFVVMANPDGYQYTFDAERLWRKNMRDIEGDGAITGREGIDLNRNFDAHWGYDPDGSSANPYSDTYRGPSPASEPETVAMQELLQTIDFSFQVNYHSAASLILYGTGWQDLTYVPDDAIQMALSGDLETPAIEDFVPMLGSGLYITNGETCDYARDKAGTLCWTPELTPGGVAGASGFEFPDNEAAIEAEFMKNLPFAFDVAMSAASPETPVSHLANETAPMYVHDFPYSHGSPQTVALDVRRSLGEVTLHYRIDGGAEVTVPAVEWEGGEKFGAEGMNHYREVRGVVEGARNAQAVEVWFSAEGERSDSFTYTVEDRRGATVLVVAQEDYTGIQPVYTDQNAPRYADIYVEALEELGYDVALYDVDAHDRLAPDALGVLSHYDAVAWYTGDDVIPRSEGMGNGTVSRQAADMMLAVRAYLNEGGKLFHAGRNSGRAYFSGLEYDPKADAPCNAEGVTGCFTLENDFYQYYLGVDGYADVTVDEGSALRPVVGAGPFEGLTITFEPPAEGVTEHAGALTPSSLRMPPSSYPAQFESRVAGRFDRPADRAHTGEHVVYSGRSSWKYQRLMRTIDVPAGITATMNLWLAYDVRPMWDAVFVEAHEVGQDDWTTLPDMNGHTSPGEGSSHCQSTNYTTFPHLTHYMTLEGSGNSASCLTQGTTGEWNPAAGNSGGDWEEWEVDLSAWAGKQVEVSISYLTSRVIYPGVLIDDITLPDGTTTSFEDDLGGWTVAGPPNGEPPAEDYERVVAGDLPPPTSGAIVVGEDSVMLGFDLSSVADLAVRTDILARAMEYLSVAPPPDLGFTIYLPTARMHQ